MNELTLPLRNLAGQPIRTFLTTLGIAVAIAGFVALTGLTQGVQENFAGGIGDQATVITWDANKDNTDYHYVTVVARSANAVVAVDFNGAGLQGDNRPKADEMNSDAQQAAKEVIGALR